MRRTTLWSAALLFLSACSDAPAPKHVVTISAAASLREVLLELKPRYEASHPGVELRVNLGASGALRQQIEHGAPVDVFISAAEAPMQALVQAGLMDGRSRRVLAGNELVVIVPASSQLGVTTLGDLAAPEVRRVALGAPASVPAGGYADEALRASGVAREVAAKAVLGQDVRQVLAFVASGNADAGIVYRTDAEASARVRIAAPVHPSLHRPITYPVAVATRAADVEAARAVVAYLLGDEGRAALRAHGFRVE